MGRYRRRHAPGVIFHLISRINRSEPLLVPELRDEIARAIQRTVGRTDARLIAYAVMPSHLHILLRQGNLPLWSIMQPLLRVVAHRVQKHHSLVGAVVERRYRDRPCLTPDHAREALVYVHLNPWRAGLCGDDLDYRWTTHRAYVAGADPERFGIAPHVARSVLELYGSAGTLGHDPHAGYLQWLEWRMQRDADAKLQAEDGDLTTARLSAPPSSSDDPWRRNFAAALRFGLNGTSPERPRRDLRDFVAANLPSIAPGIRPAALHGSWLPRRNSQVRVALIQAAAEQGYRTTELARYFGVSPTRVSEARHAGDRPRS